MNVLVFGATGFSGRHLLQATPPMVTVIPVGYPDPAPGGLTCDLLDPDRVASVVRETAPAGIINLIGPGPGADAAASWATSVLASHAVLEAARALPDSPRVLLIGSAAEYGTAGTLAPTPETAALRPSTAYGIGKAGQTLMAQYYARHHGLHVMVARPFNLVGPHLPPHFVAGRIAAQIADLELGLTPPVVRLEGVDGVRDFVDVRDAVSAYWKLLSDGEGGEVYNVATGIGRSIDDLLRRFRELATRGFDVVIEPPPVPRHPGNSIGDPAKIARGTGWRAAISLDQSLRDMLESSRRIARNAAGASAPSHVSGADVGLH